MNVVIIALLCEHNIVDIVNFARIQGEDALIDTNQEAIG